MSRKIASHYVLINGKLERHIVVEVDQTGTIIGIEQCSDLDSCAGVEFYPGILIPGMVNAHCHLELSYLRGTIAEHTGFAGFARAIGAVRGNFTDAERIRAAHIADMTMWQEGIEAVTDIANDSLIMEIKEHSKIKYHTLFEVFGLTTTVIDRHKQMAAEATTSASITPHSTYSLQDAIFRQSSAENSSVVSIHFLESEDEMALYRGAGSLHDWYTRMGWQCDFLHYGTPAERIVQSIPSDRRVMLVHNCQLTHVDMLMMEEHFQHPVSWVICPESNRYISDSLPPIELLCSMGANIAIGTDSLASARSLSMVDNMRLIKGVPLNIVLTWATLGGARAMGLNNMLGSIELGKHPGLVVLEAVDMHNMQLTPESIARRIV